MKKIDLYISKRFLVTFFVAILEVKKITVMNTNSELNMFMKYGTKLM